MHDSAIAALRPQTGELMLWAAWDAWDARAAWGVVWGCMGSDELMQYNFCLFLKRRSENRGSETSGEACEE